MKWRWSVAPVLPTKLDVLCAEGCWRVSERVVCELVWSMDDIGDFPYHVVDLDELAQVSSVFAFRMVYAVTYALSMRHIQAMRLKVALTICGKTKDNYLSLLKRCYFGVCSFVSLYKVEYE